MHGRRSHPTPQRSRATERVEGAVAWIDADRAIVARTDLDGPTVELIAHDEPAEGPFLARVVDAIGDRERVLIIGPDAARVQLEREYVAIYRRPDRIVDVQPAEPEPAESLLGRLEVLVEG